MHHHWSKRSAPYNGNIADYAFFTLYYLPKEEFCVYTILENIALILLCFYLRKGGRSEAEFQPHID